MVDSVKGERTFALESFKELAGSCTQDIIYSPYSAFMCFALGGLIAKGETKAQVMKALKITETDADPAEVARELLEIASRNEAGGQATVVSANDLWPNKELSINMSDFQILTEVMHLPVTPLQFPQPGCDTINAHVEEKTRGLVKNLLDPSSLDEATTFVLTNCLYFKAKWEKFFKPNDTRPGMFNSFDQTKEVKMMSQTSEFKYAEVDNVQYLDLPYDRSPFSMVLMLPRENSPQAIKSLVDSLSLDRLEAILTQMEEQDVSVYIPKFKATWGTRSLKEMLKTLGATRIFDSQFAELPADSFVSDILQKAVIIVDEDGTEAAAATAMIAMMRMMRPMREATQFIADHPFLYALRNTESGEILFIGSCVNPIAP